MTVQSLEALPVLICKSVQLRVSVPSVGPVFCDPEREMFWLRGAICLPHTHLELVLAMEKQHTQRESSVISQGILVVLRTEERQREPRRGGMWHGAR